MTIQIGTIQEMTGKGYEILVDQATRSYILARFYDGKLIGAAQSSAHTETQGNSDLAEQTIALQ
jgi:hypothetical protein